MDASIFPYAGKSMLSSSVRLVMICIDSRTCGMPSRDYVFCFFNDGACTLLSPSYVQTVGYCICSRVECKSVNLSMVPILILICGVMLRLCLSEPFDFGLFLGAFGLQSIVFLSLAYMVARNRLSWSLSTILAVSVLMHVVYWFQPAMLSNDVYRYHWDGWVVLQGINPLTHSPLEVISHYPRWTQYLPPDHRSISSIYPPLSLLTFAVLRGLCKHVWIYGIAMSLLNVFSSVLIHHALKFAKQRASLLIFFAWHPLLALESAHGGHIDSLGILFLCMGIYLFLAGKSHPWLSCLAAFWTKIWPIIFLPIFLRDLKDKRPAFLFMLVLFIVTLVFYNKEDFSSTGVWNYALRWEYYGPVYSAFKTLGLQVGSARMLCVGVFMFFYAGSIYFYSFKRRGDPFSCLMLSVMAFALCSPTIYPWYALWVLPMLCFIPSAEILLWSLLVVGSYSVLPAYFQTGAWQEEHSWFWLIYGIPLGVCALRMWIRIKANRGVAKATNVTKIKNLENQISEKSSL